MNLYSDCNSEQKKAIMHITGPLVVCAGAGSGKTRVIAYRVNHLVNVFGYDPICIVCVTFTNKASREMRDRIASLLQGNPKIPLVTTFHGFGLYLLRRFGSFIGFKSYSIIDEEIQKEIITDILKHMNVSPKEISPKSCISFISTIKNNIKTNEFYQLNYKAELYNEIAKQYEYKKKEAQYIDFDDILLLTLQLLKIDSIQQTLHKEIRHVLVDEYQDTNIVQHEIIKYLTLKNNTFAIDSLCVVGDEDQSIYSWRGANVDNITDFKKDFPDAQLVTLTRNYRSVQEILNLANTVIEKNSNRNPKNLWTEKQFHKALAVFEFNSGYEEADTIVSIIKKLKKNNNKESIAILYRSHYQSRLFEEACVKESIPYKVFGGINFYERQEIKDILAYAKLIVNKKDRYSFLRAIQVPSRGIGDVFINNFFDFWNEKSDLDFFEIFDEFIKLQKLGSKVRENGEKFLSLLVDINNARCSSKQALEKIIDSIGYYSYILNNAETNEEASSRRENIGELLVAAEVFDSLYNGSLGDFIDHIAIMYEREDETKHKNDVVLLMSLHAAKGLEFSTVFLVGLEEGIFPSYRATVGTAEYEEERRLLYVGITRACQRLFCTYAKQRNLWGSTRSQARSSFINDFHNQYQFFDATQMPYYLLQRTIHELLDLPYENNENRHYQAAKNHTNNTIKNDNNFKEIQLSKTSFSPYQPHDYVSHDIFGKGVILTVDRDFCNVKFENGIKKIKTSFLKKVSY